VNEAVIDTSAIIAFFRGDERAASRIAGFTRLVVPVAVVAELLAGCVGSTRKGGGLREVHAFLRSSRVSIVPATADTAERWAVIWDGLRRAGRHIPINDVWIAASAMEYGLPVFTNDRHFLDVPQILVTLADARE
jgi:tRNA(fMet)-specific endonuclease VapC